MKEFRISIASSLVEKINEHKFFLEKIITISEVIEYKSINKKFPIDLETKELSYYYSAYLNTIQSLKDGFQTALQIKISWKQLSPKYGDFIFYCRNAVTHDGSSLINAFSNNRHYIIEPLSRIDKKGNIITFNPPKEDILSLCLNITNELMINLDNLINHNYEKVLNPSEEDFKKTINLVLDSDFLPAFAKKILQDNIKEFENSIYKVELNNAKKLLDTIELVKKNNT